MLAVALSRGSSGLRRVLVALALAALSFGLTFGLGRFDFFTRVENTSYDWRVRATSAPLDPAVPIVHVDISESTVRELEPLVGRWPWPRAIHALAIDYIAGGGATAIGYDVLFGEREGRTETIVNGQSMLGVESDHLLVESVRRAGNVVLIGDATFEGAARAATSASSVALQLPGPAFAPLPGVEPRPTFQVPFDDLGAAARGVGHNYLRRDSGSDFARYMVPFIDVGGTPIPSLGMATALVHLGVAPADVRLDGGALLFADRRMPLRMTTVNTVDGRSLPSGQLVLRFAEPVVHDQVRSTFAAYSFFDLLVSIDQAATKKTPIIPASAFKGKLVLVGTSAAGLHDRYQTPFPGGAGGVELHATLAANALEGRFMRRAPALVDAAVTAAAALLSAGLAVGLPVIPATAAVLGATAIMGGVGTWAVGQGLWVAIVLPVIAAFTALFGGVAWQYFVEGRQKREIKRLFGRYVSKDVIDELLANPALAALGGERRTMTVLFSDIRGFTTAAESATPEAVVAQLNEYFGAMVDVLFRHRGTLDKFVGDMVMGLFGAPITDPDHADHAVAAALEMIDVLNGLNTTWKAQGRPVLDIGVGISTGEMIAGNVGAETIMSYTVIGDAVNLGARLESLNKEFGTHILMSEATRAALKRSVTTSPKGIVMVKGKTEPVLVHEVIGYSQPAGN